MYWLMKSELSVYPWDQLVKDKKTSWTGVRNFQAAKNLKDMTVGDEAFFYHSNDGKEIVGVMKVVKAAYADPTDKKGKFITVDVAPAYPLKKYVTLSMMKEKAAFKNMQLLKQSRLSVSKVTAEEWGEILKLSNQ